MLCRSLFNEIHFLAMGNDAAAAIFGEEAGMGRAVEMAAEGALDDKGTT